MHAYPRSRPALFKHPEHLLRPRLPITATPSRDLLRPTLLRRAAIRSAVDQPQHHSIAPARPRNHFAPAPGASPSSFSPGPSPASAGIFPDPAVEGELKLGKLFAAGFAPVALTLPPPPQEHPTPIQGVQGPGATPFRPTSASPATTHRRTSPTTQLRRKSGRHKPSVSISQTSYTFCVG